MFQGALERTRTEQLDALGGCGRILLLGEGDGRFAVELLRRFPKASITIVERSSAMLDECRRRIARLQDSTGSEARAEFVAEREINFVNADIRTWLNSKPRTSWDAIVTLFFLDCFEPAELSHIVPALAAQLRAGGVWLYADFHLPERGLVRYLARVVLTLLYSFFLTLTDIRARRLADPRPFFCECLLIPKASQRNLGGMLVSEVWQKGYVSLEGADDTKGACVEKKPAPVR